MQQKRYVVFAQKCNPPLICNFVDGIEDSPVSTAA